MIYWTVLKELDPKWVYIRAMQFEKLFKNMPIPRIRLKKLLQTYQTNFLLQAKTLKLIFLSQNLSKIVSNLIAFSRSSPKAWNTS